MPILTEEIEACDLGGRRWVYAQGHIPKSKLKGALIPQLLDLGYDLDWLWRAEIVHGYLNIRAEPDGEFCEPGYVLYFEKTEDPAAVSSEPVTYAAFAG